MNIFKFNPKLDVYQSLIDESVKNLHTLTQDIQHKELMETVSELRSRIKDPFMFVVVGEVKAGKSSFINALLGADKEICKVAPMPMTDTIQQIIYGPEEQEVFINPFFKRIFNPSEILKEIAIVDINESDLADLELQLKTFLKSTAVKMYLCDISDQNKVNKMFQSFKPDVIFHAAAYKHVPVMEKFPEEAVRVNIIGTYNLAAAVKKFNVSNFVLISTDKAVNPTSIMGVSKRIAEQIVTGMTSASTFVAVRFGNVIGSRGSALPIFLTQLKNGGPITVTHPEMKRYFMTIPEAVALVLQAAATGKNGDVFILDMGEPIKIIDLVEDLITLHNLVPNKDIKLNTLVFVTGKNWLRKS